MSRLVAFGCSFTYGHGLCDCWDLEMQCPTDQPSKLSWPSIAAKKLNIECINKSYPGASAKETLFKIQNFNFQPADITVVLWPWPQRSCIIKLEDIDLENEEFNRSAFERFMPAFDSAKNNKFYSFYNESDSIVDYYTRIEYANLFFNSKKIPVLHLIVEELYVKNFKWRTAKLENIFFTEIRDKFPLALDGVHPGELAHKEFGLEIANRINSFISC